jgi:hypothetical protein
MAVAKGGKEYQKVYVSQNLAEFVSYYILYDTSFFAKNPWALEGPFGKILLQEQSV